MSDTLATNMSKTLKNVLIALASIIIGLMLVIIVHFTEIYNETHPLFVGSFTQIMETINRYGIAFIIGGILMLVNIRKWLSKLFDLSEDEVDIDRFRQDDTYVLKSGMHTMKRTNHMIVIQQSKRKELKLCIYLAIGIVAMIYLVEPITLLVLTHLNVNSIVYKNDAIVELILYTFMIDVFIFLALALLYLFIRELAHNTFTIIDPMTKKIKYTRYVSGPLKIIWRGEAEGTLPIEDLESLEVTMQQYKVVPTGLNNYSRKPEVRELPVIAIPTKNWEGDEKLLLKLTSKRSRDRINILSNSDTNVLEQVKTLLVDYAIKGLY